MCLPVLFLSPIIANLVKDHDIFIYLSVIYIFITLLLLGTRSIGSKWTTWYQNIFIIDDKILKTWYKNHPSIKSIDTTKLCAETNLLRNARELLQREVDLARRRSLLSLFKNTHDPMVRQLASSFESTSFLMVGHT